MPKDAVSKTVQRALIGGFWYTRNPPDVTGPSSPVLTQTPVPHVTSIDATWVNGIDAQSGIASTYAEISPNGMNVWTRTVLPWPASSTTFTGLASGTAYDIRLANLDASANANVSAYSSLATVSTLGSPIDLAPGTIALAVTSVTVNEGGTLSIGVVRSGAGVAAPDTSVDWQMSGFNQGTPSPANNTLTWIGGDNSTQFIVTTAGSVTSTQTGTLRLVNPRAATGNITPTLGLAAVPVTILATVASGLKWKPGDRAGSQNPTFADDHKLQFQITEQNLVLSSGANVLGWNGYYYPACFQTVLGSWDFSKILRDLNRLRSMTTPKDLSITIIPQVYGNTNYASVLPATVYNNSIFGPSPVAGKYGWWSAQGSTSAVLAFWRPAVMDWVISMFQTLAATVNPSTGLTIDADPFVACTSFGELAAGVDAGDATFSLSALITQYKRLIDAINVAWPTTIHICQNNLSVSSASFAQDITNYCYANRTAIGGPDTFVPGQKPAPALTGGQASVLGIASGVAGFTGPDLRGKAALMCCTQGPEISNAARYKMFTMHTFHTQINTVLQQGYRFFTMISINATDDPIPAYPTDGPNTSANPGNWHQALQVINGSPLTHIAKPTSLLNVAPPPPPSVIFYDNFESKQTYPLATPDAYKVPYHADSTWNLPAPFSGYAKEANGFQQTGNAGIFILPRSQINAALLADPNFPSSKQQIYEGRVQINEVETWTDFDFSSFGLFDAYFSFWEFRPTGGQKAGEKFFCVTRALAAGQSSGGQIIWGLAPLATGSPGAAAGHMGVFNNSSDSFDFPEQDFNINVDGSLTHWEFRYFMSTGTNADGIYQVWQNGTLVCNATGIRNNTLAADRVPWAKVRITAWSSGTINSNGGYPIYRDWCAFKIATTRQGVWPIT